MKICLINLIKGGTGKTTLSVNIYTELLRQNKQTLLVDLDTDQLASKDFCNRAGLECVANPTKHELSKLFKTDKTLIFDTGGFDNPITQAIISACDVVLVPTSFDAIELNALEKLHVKIAKIRVIMKKDIKLYIVPTRIDYRQQLINTNLLKEFVLQTIHYRSAYKKAYALGVGVTNYKDAKAKTEIYNLVQQILSNTKI